MKQISVCGSVLTLAFFNSFSAVAHHSIAGTYDPDDEIVLENVTILDWRFANPHAFLVFEAPNADGELTEWRASTQSVTSLRRNGYTRETFQPGQVITIKGLPGLDDRPIMEIEEVALADGTVIHFSEPAPASVIAAARANTAPTSNPLIGIWEFVRGPVSDEARALAPDDAYFLNVFGQVSEAEEGETGDVPVTAEGRNFQSNWNDTDDECVAISGWMGGIAPYLIEIEEMRNSRVRINYQYMDLERTVWLDGRRIPDVDKVPRTSAGYSVGHWEAETLVVETRNMHSNIVTRNGIHHSENALLTERISRDGDTLTIERRIDDPDRFLQPIVSVVQRRRADETEITPWGECVPSL